MHGDETHRDPHRLGSFFALLDSHHDCSMAGESRIAPDTGCKLGASVVEYKVCCMYLFGQKAGSIEGVGG